MEEKEIKIVEGFNYYVDVLLLLKYMENMRDDTIESFYKKFILFVRETKEYHRQNFIDCIYKNKPDHLFKEQYLTANEQYFFDLITEYKEENMYIIVSKANDKGRIYIYEKYYINKHYEAGNIENVIFNGECSKLLLSDKLLEKYKKEMEEQQ